ncbi:MAG: carbohydrate kinase family protein [Spirochaetaceae bacterium]|jgi:pseudouridine kinase|nr:carbohydrate kinase family protein [Spirochaetaceae bacterium]
MKAAVIGGANVDIVGRSIQSLIMADSNPAYVRLSAGGVARNIAENLFRLGVEVSLVSALGDDRFAGILRGFLEDAGMDTGHLLTREGLNTGLYVAVMKPSGELLVSLNDMEAVMAISPADAAKLEPLLAAQDMTVFDANLRADTILVLARTARKAGKLIAADAVSTAKAERLRPVLGQLDLLKANRAEAAVLTGFPLDNEKAVREGCAFLLGAGVKEVHITLGRDGACSASASDLVFRPPLQGLKINVNGGGDAFAAGVIYSRCRGGGAEENGLFGAVCSAIALETPEAVSRSLTRDAAEARAAQARAGGTGKV